MVRRAASSWYLDRKVIFNRVDLRPDRQLVYDQNGQMVTDTAYSDIRDFNGIEYPTTITIWRPIEEYSITLHVVKLVINQSLRDDQFVLAQPPGAQVVYLDQPTQPGNRANAAAPK